MPTSTFTPIASDAPYYDQFDNGMTQWKVYDGAFSAQSKSLVAPDSNTGKALLNTDYSDFIFEADITISGGPVPNRNPGLMYRVSDPSAGPDSYHGYCVGITADGQVVLGSAANNWNQLASATATVAVGQVHRLKVRAVGNKFSVWIDDMRTPKLTVTDSTYKSGMTGVKTYQTGAIFDNVQILPLKFWDDFSSKTLDKWHTYSGDFDASGGLIVAQPSGGSMAVISDHLFGDFVMEVDMTVMSAGDVGLVLRITSPTDGNVGYYGYYVGMSNGNVVFGRVGNGWTELSRKDASDIQVGFNHLKVLAKGPNFSIYVNDMIVPKIVVSDATYGTGLAGVRVHNCGSFIQTVAVYNA